ncbi:hypothetical protein BH18THE2_BH18THE2_40290 [soil metagenome]
MCNYEDSDHFQRPGILSLLEEDIKKEITDAYVVIITVNESTNKYNRMEMEATFCIEYGTI